MTKKMTVKEARFDAIIDHCLANPTHTISEIAAAFDVSKSWMYSVTASDLFQARLGEARENIRETIVATVGDKLTGTLSLGLDRLSEKLEDIESPEYILQAVDVLSRRYTDLKVGKSPITATQNNFFANPDALKELQQQALSAAHRALPHGASSAAD